VKHGNMSVISLPPVLTRCLNWITEALYYFLFVLFFRFLMILSCVVLMFCYFLLSVKWLAVKTAF